MDGCGGWLITHDDGTVECVDVDCIDPTPTRHDWRAACGELDDPCTDCTEPVPARQQRAA